MHGRWVYRASDWPTMVVMMMDWTLCQLLAVKSVCILHGVRGIPSIQLCFFYPTPHMMLISWSPSLASPSITSRSFMSSYASASYRYGSGGSFDYTPGRCGYSHPPVTRSWQYDHRKSFHSEVKRTHHSLSPLSSPFQRVVQPAMDDAGSQRIAGAQTINDTCGARRLMLPILSIP